MTATREAGLDVCTQDLPRSAARPFYVRLNQILDQHDFDGYLTDSGSEAESNGAYLFAGLTQRSLEWTTSTFAAPPGTPDQEMSNPVLLRWPPSKARLPANLKFS
jgi:hypothetical protein